MKLKLTLMSIMYCCSLGAPAVSADGKTAAAVRFPSPPVIDGTVNEEVWNLAPPVEGLIQFVPQNGRPSDLRTVVRFGYDDDALYVSFVCYDPNPGEIAAALTRRDSDLGFDDCVGVFLDTLDDNQTGTAFVTNLLGTQWDFRITDNGRASDTNWDATWYSAASLSGEGWSVEYAIPFRILKYEPGADRTWGLNFARTCPRHLETSYWAGPLPDELRISQYGELTGLDLPDKVKRYEFLPYALVQVESGEPPDSEAGFDFSYRVTSTLGGNVTVNPDFATIEADAEEINLTRFERFIDEKRPFFLEGAEMFDQRVTQFYSRRVGDIPWGVKLNGNVGGWDLAVLTAQSDPARTAGDTAGLGTDATYSVFRVKKGVFGASNVGLLVANREWKDDNQGSAGLDATLYFSETLGMTAQFIRAHGPEDDGALTWFLRPAFDNANSHFHVRYANWDEGLMKNMNTVGFVEDEDRKQINSKATHTLWPRSRGVERIEGDIEYDRYWSQEGVLRSEEIEAEVEVEFVSKWELEITHFDEYKLYEKEFDNRETKFELSYDTRQGRRAEVSYGFGRSFDSDLRVVRGETLLKLTDSWRFDYNLTRLWLDPDPGDETTWIHSLRSDYYMTPDLYLKLFFQTNTAIDKENTQAALVWRFLPPFGSLQLAYQRGTSMAGTRSDQGHTLFTKLSWVF
jgi:hypothetical protein